MQGGFRGDSRGLPDPALAREAWARGAWSLVATLVVAGLVAWLAVPLISGRSAEKLGVSLTELEARSAAGEIVGFTWEGALASSTWYEADLFELREGRSRRAIVQSRRLYEESWFLTEEERSALSGSLELQVEVVGPGGVIDRATMRMELPR